MSYVPAFCDRRADVVRRPWRIEAAAPQLAVLTAREQLAKWELAWKLVQVTVAVTGESVFRVVEELTP